MLCILKSIPRCVFLNVLQTFQVVHLMKIRLYLSSNSSTSVTSLDDFTTHLVQQKGEKWLRTARKKHLSQAEAINTKKQELELSKEGIKSSLNVENMSAEIDSILLRALDSKNYSDMNAVVDQCSKYNKPPSVKAFLEAISVCSREGLKDEIAKLNDLLYISNPIEYENNAKLKHFHAELMWKQGNVEEAIKHFIDLYDEFLQLRPKILKMSLHMIFELVSKGSDANLVMMINFARTYHQNFNELQPLCLIWELLFLSEWYSDQVWSKELLEQNPVIFDKVKLRFLPIAMFSLQKHDVDTVQRILELMLAHKQRQSYIILLHILFDYKCDQNDLRGCTEIMNVAITQGIPMRSSHHVKFLHLLLGKKKPDTMPVTKISVPRYTLKF